MGSFIRNSVLFSVLILVISIAFVFYDDFKNSKDMKRLEIWAKENRLVLDQKENKLTPFQVEYSEEEWNFLVKKLELSRYFEPLKDQYAQRNEFGFDAEYAKELVQYWKEKFDWKSRVNYINRYPQFKIKIDDDVTIHFVRVVTNKNEKQKPIPLMIMDGWPGHFFGFYKMIDYMNETYKDLSFDIIVPSIPGFGYSTPLYKVVDYVDTAMYFDAIMRYIHGENVQYYIHGEDWGSVVTNTLAKLYPDRVKGIHISWPSFPKFTEPYFLGYLLMGQVSQNLIHTRQELDAGFVFNFGKIIKFLLKSTGFFHIQATKPDTLGFGLADSPIGLLAWILEKYQVASFGEARVFGKKDGNLDAFNRDEYLSIVTYYWMTNSITSSCRYYRAFAYSAVSEWPKNEISNYKTSEKVASAIQYFKHEVTNIPYHYLKRRFLNLKRFNVEQQGGHFAAWENPKVVANDFVEFVKSIL